MDSAGCRLICRQAGREGARKKRDKCPKKIHICHDLFDNRELTEAEKQETEAAIKEIESYPGKTIRVKVKEKPVRKPLPDNLPRREEHHYPEIDNGEEYDKLPAEITEVLEHEPGKCYVRKIIRHKYVLKTPGSDVITTVITAPCRRFPCPAVMPAPRCYRN